MKPRDLLKKVEQLINENPKDITTEGIETIYNNFSNELSNRMYDIPTNIQKGEIDLATDGLEQIAYHLFILWDALKTRGDDIPEVITPEFSKELPE